MAAALILCLVFGSIHAYGVLLVPIEEWLSASRVITSLGYSLAIVALTIGVPVFAILSRRISADVSCPDLRQLGDLWPQSCGVWRTNYHPPSWLRLGLRPWQWHCLQSLIAGGSPLQPFRICLGHGLGDCRLRCGIGDRSASVRAAAAGHVRSNSSVGNGAVDSSRLCHGLTPSPSEGQSKCQ